MVPARTTVSLELLDELGHAFGLTSVEVALDVVVML